MEYTKSLTNYNRNFTCEVNAGGIKIGSENPIVVQTMCNTSTNDIEKTVAQIVRIVNKTGCKIVRVTVPSLKDVEALKEIHSRIDGLCTLVADVHFNAAIAFECAKVVEKVRVNPGNFGHHSLPCLSQEEFEEEGRLLDKTFSDFLAVCKQHKTAVRIGTNHGSLSSRILNRFGDTPEGMVESVMEFLRVAVRENFSDIVISLKSSNPTVAIRAARLMVKKMKDENMNFPLHLGVTEAGEGEDGRLKSAAGICPLLNDGIGDTIRVSLTENPENEILPAEEIVSYADYIKGAEKLPEIPFFYDPYNYKKREVLPFNNGIAAVAVIVSDKKEAEQENLDLKPDFVIDDDKKNDFVFVDEDTDFSKINKTKTLVAKPKNKNQVGAFRYIFYQLEKNGMKNPVLLCPQSKEDFKIASDCAGVFIDGFGDGICLESNGNFTKTVRLAFKILQISRLRITGNEYVSCPGCGRTLYDLQSTVKKIKEATKNYKNLKIAVMGCIVNGPGEMADADYGYVGDGKNKISLYKDGKIIKKSIPEEEAVGELLKLIDSLH
ncbi:MAG: flavodoxin-dependent (E)-4-hydroxy-3-methylbut-2-enyl-diphosphate synthase [Bacteroidales bacterium]|nr:flavodoxin-dependent (E)-4-hydroxy-3-methylbut-2-enyl-diphosphate synthase [Bacteroidales bacterium]